jgi:Lrp/AsnC family leucine-responsive transcriptional regulator
MAALTGRNDASRLMSTPGYRPGARTLKQSCTATLHAPGAAVGENAGNFEPRARFPLFMDLDRFDLAILDALQHDSRVTAEGLGQTLGLSATAVQRRIRRLKAEGAIEAEVAVLAPDVLRAQVTVIVELAFKQGLTAAIDAFRRQALAHAEIQQCFYVAGEYDFVLVIVSPSMADYERFTRRVFFPNDNIARFRSTVAMDTVKRGLQLPLAAALQTPPPG